MTLLAIMETRTCSTCHREQDITQFERRGTGYRSECRGCRGVANRARHAKRRADARAAKHGPEQPAVPAHERAAIINTFALWFGPVDRDRPLAWGIGAGATP